MVAHRHKKSRKNGKKQSRKYMLEKASNNLWKSMILRRRNLDLDMVFIDPTQCWHFKPKVLKMFQKVTQKHLKIKVRAHEKQLQKPYQKNSLKHGGVFLFFDAKWSPKRHQNLSFFFYGETIGTHFGSEMTQVAPRSRFCLKIRRFVWYFIWFLNGFWVIFEWLFLELWWNK